MPNKRNPDPHSPPVTTEGFAGQDDIFFAAVEKTRMPMIVTDPRLPDNPIVFANVAFIDMTGYDEDEIVGRNCRFLQGPATDPETVAAVREAIENRTDIAVEILNYHKDGSTFWNALFISPVFDASGNLIYFFASQLDVSRRRDAEDALRQAQKMEAVGQLTGGIAHDFNNMLTVIMGNLDMARERVIDPVVRDRIERAIEGARRAETLTSQLLAFARKQRLDGRPINLNALVSGLMEMVDRTLGSDVSIRTDFADDLDMARVDSVQAEVALLNILINARDAMPEGGQVTIQTRNVSISEPDPQYPALEKGAYVVLSVIDTGQGIPKSVLGRVMEPFFTTKEVGKGTGMGLAMVYGFMRQSQGHLLIRSDEGQGTRVEMVFPATSSEAEESAGPETRSAKGGSEIILMVEDNPDVMEMGSGMLRDVGYDVLTAENGEAALNILRERKDIALLFTDIVMPGGINGVSLASEARALHPKLRILLTTGWADRALENSEDRSGFDLIGKPYRKFDLVRKVRVLMDGPTGV